MLLRPFQRLGSGAARTTRRIIDRLLRIHIVNRTFAARDRFAEDFDFGVPLPLFLTPPTFLGMMGSILLGSYLLTQLVPFDRGNYQWVLAAELQAMAAIFGLAIVGTLTVASVIRRLMFMPSRMILVVLLSFVAVMIADVVTLLSLDASPPSYPMLFVVNLVVSLNLVPLLAVLSFLIVVIDWLQPTTYISGAVNRFATDRRPAARRRALFAFEDIGAQVSERRDVEAGLKLHRAFAVTAELVIRNETRNHTGDVELVMLVDVMTRLSEAYSRAQTGDLKQDLSKTAARLAETLSNTKVVWDKRGASDLACVIDALRTLSASSPRQSEDGGGS